MGITKEEFYESLEESRRFKIPIDRDDLPEGIYEYAKNLFESELAGDCGITILPLTPEGEHQRLEDMKWLDFGHKDYNFYYNGELFNIILTYHD
jgi:hypothetical protein